MNPEEFVEGLEETMKNRPHLARRIIFLHLLDLTIRVLKAIILSIFASLAISIIMTNKYGYPLSYVDAFLITMATLLYGYATKIVTS